MDLPQPPQDTELRNIIDKLAQFVARNGPEFEQMTKNKQKGNPKFQFLYGGEYFNYYQYKVTTEQAILKQQGIGLAPQSDWNQPQSVITQDSPELEHLTQQQDALREQIKQSEQNLNAQHTVLLQQQQAQVEETITKCQLTSLQEEAEQCNLQLNELYKLLQPIIDSCTKDSISNGKSWILQHATSKERAICISHCLLYKVVQGNAPFSQKLHIIYLVNDVLHHCARKNAIDLKEALEKVVVPMMCNASIGATEDQAVKLEKLLKLWESKSNYLSSQTVDKMRQPAPSYQQFKTDEIARFANEVAPLAQQTKVTFEGYQQQHQAFVCHAMQQIMDLQNQKQAIEQQQQSVIQQQSQGPQQPIQSQPPPQHSNLIPLDALRAEIQQNMSQQQLPPLNDRMNNGCLEPNDITLAPPPPTINQSNSAIQPIAQSNGYVPPMNPNVPPPCMSQPAVESLPPFTQPPPGFFPPPGMFPDFSKPPPGFPPTAQQPPKPEPEELLPTVPYYDLPAGLMVPLIKLEDTSFKPLDPKDIRLPPPQPPSERLLASVEAFYAPPSHERPRDSEGWEKLGLYEYYKAKNNAKREKDEAIKAGLREKSRSPSPVVIPIEKEPSPPRRRYSSLSPTTTSSTNRKKSRSRSRSPRRHRRRSRSRSRSRNRRRNSRRSPSSSRSRSRSRSPPSSMHSFRRSPSPPSSFGFGNNFSRSDVLQEQLDSNNKGHQMLRKMGWGGSGLGAHEQGIDSPISGGDVRDRQDQFKGVGCDLNDPYENFRKNKGAAFITRMKARAEERANESK
ncbi:calcium homeostasis endoplasmic reticulum protein isoform X2 [Agrilus planipennis]|uniref:Calcium homeostasis endoplasmic reticulum protein isoform X2 n=1 Tax=Agrilus planipennis TaxID=224129 RepID=A0A1W4WUZ9_AGRPL|nr:calcium homeostasis endoplasmic reticulum protein isoform X2 [Agrilus planipennis]